MDRRCVMATVEEIQKLYDLGKIPEAMAAVLAEVNEERPSSDPEIGKLMVIRAWCHWRRQEWDDALESLEAAEKAGGAEPKTKRLRAYFAAYRDKNDEALRAIAQELPNDVGVLNALVIRARDEDSTLTHAEIGKIVLSISGEGVEAANLNHNGARFFLAKSRDEVDLNSAIGMLDRAIRLYGIDGNWHHRAAATHWKSVAFERLGDRAKDAEARTQARQLWEKAVGLDSTNQGFRMNLKNAQAREAELVK